MPFAPVLGLKTHSRALVPSSISAYFASLAALCSSLFSAILAFVDNLAMRIPPSCCIVCQVKSLRDSFSSTENKTTALVFDPSTDVYSLKRLEDIDVEKAIYRDFLPSSAQSIKVQFPGETKCLAEVCVDDGHSRRRLKHQRSLVDGFYIMPGRAGTQVTVNPKDANEDQLAELPAPGFFNHDKEHPVELLADEASPAAPQPAPPTPILALPRPRSPNTRKASPLLAPPPMDRIAEQRGSCGSSVGSLSIQIAYLPSYHDDD